MPSSNSKKPSEIIGDFNKLFLEKLNELEPQVTESPLADFWKNRNEYYKVVNQQKQDKEKLMISILDEFELRISALETSKNRVYKFDKLVYHPHDPQEKCTGNCPQ